MICEEWLNVAASERNALNALDSPDPIWRFPCKKFRRRAHISLLSSCCTYSTELLLFFLKTALSGRAEMASVDAKKSKKRRASGRDEEEVVVEKKPVENVFAQDVGLEMQSEDEGGDEDEDAESDDGHVDQFPEIDTRSDSEEDEDADTEEDEDEEEDEPDESEDEFSDDSLQIFPKAKTVVSEITGQPKRVYPPIEPDYDSDSSTEDVRPTTFYID